MGASAAIASEVSVVMLLYAAPGFLRSLTTILTIQGAALSLGLWTAPRQGGTLIHRLRRRWLACLITYIAAALYGIAWSLFPEIGSGRWGQGVGLAVLAGAPLYVAGIVIGGMISAVRTDAEGRVPEPGVAVAVGATLGFALNGLLLARAPMPASLFVLCVVLLSLGGMTFGSVMDRHTQVEVRGRRTVEGAETRVEDRRRPAERLAERILLEGRAPRRRVKLIDGRAEDAWDVALLQAVLPSEEESWHVLMVGGGASAGPAFVLERHPRATVHVLESSPEVVELGREFFGTELSVGRGDRCRVEVGRLDDLIVSTTGAFDLVLLDGAAVVHRAGMTGLTRAARLRLPELVAAGGALAWGPHALDPSEIPLPDDWSRLEFERSPGSGSAEVLGMAMRGSRPTQIEGFRVRSGVVSE